MKRLRSIILLTTIVLASLTLAFKEDLFLVSKNLDIFASLYKEININYVEETNATDLMRTGIDSMLEGLDPYTEYIPESEIEDYKLKYISTQYGGIGAATLFKDGKLFVNEVSEGNPANKQDVKPGDEIISINGIKTQGKERSQISQLLRGPKGSTLTLSLLRDGVVINKSLVREEIKQPNVTYSGMLADQIGYIKLDKFLENSGKEVKDALETINKDNPKGIILDLRNNGGGIVQEAIKIVNLFTAKDLLIVIQKGRNPEKTVKYMTLNQPVSLKIPLIVLINGNSASASEIVAGALQDLDRAVVIGQRSYGKGLVQQTFNLPYNSLVKVTVAKYYTPSGRCLQALDYAHKNKNGGAEKIADSLMKAFTTKAGRIVYDGNGIYPDVFIESPKLSPITIALANKNLFFDFANSYKKNNTAFPNVKTFQLSDAAYNLFVTAMADQDYTYTAKTEQLLAALKTQAEIENKLQVVKSDLEDLKLKMLGAKKTDLIIHKTEIKRFLETQIISRYYYDKGKVEQALQYDTAVAQAKLILTNPNLQLSILNGSGNYKTIGKPLREK